MPKFTISNSLGVWATGFLSQPLMMTSSNGNTFRVTGPLCGEFTDDRWIALTKASDAELWCFLWSALLMRLAFFKIHRAWRRRQAWLNIHVLQSILTYCKQGCQNQSPVKFESKQERKNKTTMSCEKMYWKKLFAKRWPGYFRDQQVMSWLKCKFFTWNSWNLLRHGRQNVTKSRDTCNVNMLQNIFLNALAWGWWLKIKMLVYFEITIMTWVQQPIRIGGHGDELSSSKTFLTIWHYDELSKKGASAILCYCAVSHTFTAR